MVFDFNFIGFSGCFRMSFFFSDIKNKAINILIFESFQNYHENEEDGLEYSYILNLATISPNYLAFHIL